MSSSSTYAGILSSRAKAPAPGAGAAGMSPWRALLVLTVGALAACSDGTMTFDGGGPDEAQLEPAAGDTADAETTDRIPADDGMEAGEPDGTDAPPGDRWDLKVIGASLYNGDRQLVLLGASTYMWTDMQTHPWEPCVGWTVAEFADRLASYNGGLTRTFCIDTWTSTIFPWLRVGDGFDLEQFDPVYMANLRSLVTTFGSSGIIVQLALFDNVALYDFGPGTWPRHPFNAANGGPISDPQNGRPEFYNPTPEVRALQEMYIRTMVSSLSDLGNVIFEVCNEYNGGGGAEWHNWVSDIIKDENPRVLVVANVDISVQDAVFRHDSIDITAGHTGDWTTGDFSGGVNQASIDRFRSYGKPTLFSSDGCQENYAAQLPDMVATARAVIAQGLSVEFKDYYEPLLEQLAPYVEPVFP